MAQPNYVTNEPVVSSVLGPRGLGQRRGSINYVPAMTRQWVVPRCVDNLFSKSS